MPKAVKEAELKRFKFEEQARELLDKLLDKLTNENEAEEISN